MERKPLKIINQLIVFFSIIFGFVGIIVEKQFVMTIIVVISSIIGTFSLSRAEKLFSVSKTIISVYYLIEVTIQGAFSMFWPQMIIGSNYNKYYDIWLFSDVYTITRHFGLCTAFLLLANVIFSLIDRSNLHYALNGRSLDIVSGETWNTCLVNAPFVWLIISVIVKSYINMTPLSNNGYIDFFLSGLNVFCLGGAVVSCVSKSLDSKALIKILFALSLYAIPGILQGRRVFIMQAVLSTIVFVLVIAPDKLIQLIKRRKILFGIVTAVVLFVFGLANLTKFGVFNPLGLLVSRITGLFDSCVVIKYLETNDINLSFSNFWKCAFNDSGIRANKYYTYYIMNFPKDRSNGYAAPIYTISLLYGPFDWLWINTLFLTIFGIVAKNVVVIYKKIYNEYGEMNIVCMYKLFIGCTTLVIIIQKYFLDGNIEFLKEFSIPIVAYFLIAAVLNLKRLNKRKI